METKGDYVVRKGTIKRVYGTVEFSYEHPGHFDECECPESIIIRSGEDWWHLQDELKEGDYVEIVVRQQ